MKIEKGEIKYIGFWDNKTKQKVVKEADQETMFDDSIWNYQFFDTEEELNNWYNN